MDIERIQVNVSLLEHASISDFNDDLVTSLHRITDVLDDLQPRLVDPADLSKEAEQKVLNTLSELTARLDRLESHEWTEDSIEEVARTTVRNMDFSGEVEVWAK